MLSICAAYIVVLKQAQQVSMLIVPPGLSEIKVSFLCFPVTSYIWPEESLLQIDYFDDN